MFNNLQDVTLYRRGVMFKGDGREEGLDGYSWAALLPLLRVTDPRPVTVLNSNSQNSTDYLSRRFVTALDILLRLSHCIWPYLTQTGGFPPQSVSVGWSQFVLETRLGRPGPAASPHWAGPSRSAY